MKRLLYALSLMLLVGLFALSGPTTRAHAYNISSNQAQVTTHSSYETVAWHRYWADDDDFGGPYVQYYYEPYYYPYPYSYYYGPGFSINTPFFGFNIP